MVTAITGSPVVALEGWTITLTFSVTDSLPQVLLTSSDWRVTNSFGTHTIAQEDPRFTFAANFLSIIITPVLAADEGTYTLNARNEAGLMGSASIVVDVQCKWPNLVFI